MFAALPQCCVLISYAKENSVSKLSKMNNIAISYLDFVQSPSRHCSESLHKTPLYNPIKHGMRNGATTQPKTDFILYLRARYTKYTCFLKRCRCSDYSTWLPLLSLNTDRPNQSLPSRKSNEQAFHKCFISKSRCNKKISSLSFGLAVYGTMH